MRYRLLILLAMLPAMAVAGDLTVTLQTGDGLSAATEAVLRREVESLLSPSLIRVSWSSPTVTPPQAERIAVIRFKGSCSAAPVFGSTRITEPESLGKTYVTDGVVLPIAEVRCDSVRRFIAAELGRTRSEDRDELLGKALGRVISHELYHILLRTTAHGRDGVAKPAQTSSELIRERVTFARTDEKLLASSAVEEPPEMPGFDSGR